jgi:hypothetical protein
MTRILLIIVRLFVMLAGYLAAALAASAFLHLLVLGSLGFTADQMPGVVGGTIVFSIPFIAIFVAYFAFMPAIVVLAIAEILARRDWLTYAIGGAAVGIAIAALYWQGNLPNARELGIAEPQPDGGPALTSPAFHAMMVGGGVVGGLIYWLIAGRFAGNWRRRRDALAAPPTSPAP